MFNSRCFLVLLLVVAAVNMALAFVRPALKARGVVKSTQNFLSVNTRLMGKKGGKGGGGAATDDGEFDWKTARKGIEEKMAKSLESIQSQMNTLRASGANPSMLDRIFVDCYGSLTPLNEVARVASSGASQLVIEPFDKEVCKEIEKAISMSDLNLSASNDGSGILRINVPALTEERRKDLVKQAKSVCEDGKVAIRNHRRDGVDMIKGLEKGKTIGKDDSKGMQDDLQKLTETTTKKLDTLLKTKETDLLKV